MNLLIVSSELPYPPHIGGGPLKLYHVLKELSPRHRITLLSCTERDVRAEWLEALSEIGVESRICQVHDGMACRFPDQPWAWRKYWSTEVVDELCRFLQTRRFDLAHLDMPPMARLLPLIDQVPRVFAPNDSLSLSAWRQLRVTRVVSRAFPGQVRRYLIQRAFERRWFSQANVCVVVSREEQNALRRTCPSLDIAVIPNGVDTRHFIPSDQPRDPNLVLFTGTMDYRPNIDAALWFCGEVWPSVHAQNPASECALVGRRVAPEVAELDRIAGVKVVGEVPDMRPWLQRCGIYVSPLRLGGGIKNKVLEALASGCPIVCTDVGAAGLEDAISGEHVLRADAARGLSSALLRLQADKESRDRFSLAARRFAVERYGWDRTAKSYEDVYAALIIKYKQAAKG